MSLNINDIVEEYLRDIHALSSNETSLDEILEKALDGERALRQLFALIPQDPRLRNLHYGLIDVFGIPASARRTRSRPVTENSNEFSKQHLFPLRDSERRAHLSPSTVPTFDAFLARWDLFSHGVLSKMTAADWENVIVAGGSVLAALMSQPLSDTSAATINQFYLGKAWGSSDIDLFLWGMSAEQAIFKIRDIHAAIEALGWPVTCVRKANVISIHTDFPYRPVQIVLRLYDTPAQILTGFDVDAACCAFDGQSVWVNPRSLTAIMRQANTIDISRRSPSYEARLAKYAERGFEVYLPSLSRTRVKISLYDEYLLNFPKGLARLLVFERLYRNNGAYIFLRYPRVRLEVEKSVTSEGEDPLEGIAEDTPALEKSFYESDLRWCQIPFGPRWDARRIEKAVADKDRWLNSPWNRANAGRETHKHVVFAGTLQRCIAGEFCDKCIAVHDAPSGAGHAAEVGINVFIQGAIEFMERDPGRQLLTGSFQPIDDEEWEREAYASASEYIESMSELMRSIAIFRRTSASGARSIGLRRRAP